jgi:hypothetical protein
MKTTAGNHIILLSSLSMRRKIRLFFLFKPYQKYMLYFKLYVLQRYKKNDISLISGIAPGLSKRSKLKATRKSWG